MASIVRDFGRWNAILALPVIIILVILLGSCLGSSNVSVPNPLLSINPASFSFSNQIVGIASMTQTVTLMNTGNLPLAITSIIMGGSNPGDFKVTNTCGSTLAVGANCTASATFTPSALGPRAATVTVTDNAPGSPQTVTLSGTGTDPVPVISSVSPPSASVGSTSQTLTINGSNFVSASTVTYNGLAHTALFVSASQLTISLTAADQAAGGSFPVVVTNPAPGGGPSNAVSFVVDQAPAITSAASTEFRYGSMGTFTVIATGFPAPSLSESGALPGGVTFASATGALSGTPTSVGTFPITITAHNGVGPDSVQMFTLTANRATLTVSANNAASTYGQMPGPFTPSYAGFVNGDTAATALTGAPSLSTTATSSSPAGTYPINVAVGTLTATNYTFSGFTSGTLTVGKATLTVTANNAASTYGQMPGPFTPSYAGFVNGDTAATALTGAPSLTTTATASSPAGSYPIVAALGSLAAANYSFGFVNGILTINNPMPAITGFSPTSSSAGAAAQTLTINGTNFVSGATVTYNGVPHADTVLSSMQITIQLSLADQSVAGNFPVVVFNPGPGGGPSLAVNFPISGVAGPVVSLSVGNLDFGYQPLSTTTNAQNITLMNTGTATLNITNIGLSGANQSDFAQSNSCGSSLTAGNICMISIKFTPSLTQPESATLSFVDNAADSPQTVLLTGNGVNISVNWASSEQTIDGFGAATAGFILPLSTSPTNLPDFFFDPGKGIGLSILRVRVIPDMATCTAYCNGNDLGAPGCACVNSSGATILTGELQIIQQAQARGVTTFMATSWSPPGSMKNNGTGSWGTGGSFDGGTANYTSFASILTSYVSVLAANNVNLFALSPQNEPATSQDYPSCLWTAQQFHDFIPYLYANLQGAGFGTVNIMFPENGAWATDFQGFAAITMSDPSVTPDVGILAQHGYGGSNIAPPNPNYGKHVWMSEVSSPSGTYDGSMSDALHWAQNIHSYLTIANANAYVWWYLTDMVGQNYATDNSALTDINGNIPLRAYVTGNWSKFVRPGWHRVDLTNSGSLLVSAFQSADGTQSAVVVVNPSSSSTTQFFGLGAQMGTSVTPWVTSAGQSLISQPTINVVNGVLSYSIPADSVVTFVGSAN